MRKWGNAAKNQKKLGLKPGLRTDVDGFHTVFRVAPDGQLVVELVVRFVQEDKSLHDDASLGGLRVWGGATVIASAHGKVRYIVRKQLTPERIESIRKWVEQADAVDSQIAFSNPKEHAARMSSLSFRRMHRGLR